MTNCTHPFYYLPKDIVKQLAFPVLYREITNDRSGI